MGALGDADKPYPELRLHSGIKERMPSFKSKQSRPTPRGYSDSPTWQPHHPLDRRGSLLASRADIPWTKWALT